MRLHFKPNAYRIIFHNGNTTEFMSSPAYCVDFVRNHESEVKEVYQKVNARFQKISE